MQEEQYVQPGLRLGVKPTDPHRLANTIRLRDVMTGTVPAHPLVDDNFAKVKSFGLYQNNKFGVCGPTSLANLYRLITAYLTDGQKNFTDADVFDLYKRSGNPNFDPATGADDNGVDMSVMLSAAVKGGIGGVHPLAFAKVDPHDFEEMRAAIAIFGGVLWGSDLQQAQSDQFSEHQVWDYVSGSPDWGGHATLTGKYLDDANDRNDRMWTVTWETAQPVTNAFVNHSVEECWVVVWPENVGTRQFQAGIDATALTGAYQSLTGQTLNLDVTPPVAPAPSNPPAPQPTPAPGGGGQGSIPPALLNALRQLYSTEKASVAALNDVFVASGITKKGS